MCQIMDVNLLGIEVNKKQQDTTNCRREKNRIFRETLLSSDFFGSAEEKVQTIPSTAGFGHFGMRLIGTGVPKLKRSHENEVAIIWTCVVISFAPRISSFVFRHLSSGITIGRRF